MNNHQFTKVFFYLMDCINILDNTESEVVTTKQEDEIIKNKLIEVKDYIAATVNKSGNV